jgi:prephenate dehydrogenase
MTIQRLSILGVGLLGGSIGLALKKSLSSCKIVGYGHRPQTLESALKVGAIHEYTSDPTQAVRDCDVAILCTPVGTFEKLLKQIAPGLKEGAIVTDVGSTKRSVVKMGEMVLPSGTHFVGSHPMAGSEKRGVEYAREDLFSGALCITTPMRHTDPAALRSIESLWTTLGMRVTRLSPDDHDRLLCDVSHLPHALAAALVMMQPSQGPLLAGKGFHDTTRIAAGDPGLWRDIFMDNRDNLRISMSKLRSQIDQLESLLASGDSRAIEEFLDAAAKRRALYDHQNRRGGAE